MSLVRSAESAGTRDHAASVPRRRALHVGSVGMILGGLIIGVGSLLPWVSTPLGSFPGTAGAGLWTLSAGAIAVAGALLPFRRVAFAHALVPGLAVAGLVGWQLVRLIHLSATTAGWGRLLPGMGLVMVTGGAVILLRTARRIWRAE